MGANQVLVDAAFKEQANKYGGDVINMKPMYDSNTASTNKMFGVINSAMGAYSAKKEVGRAGVRKQMAGFQKDADALVKGMYAQNEPMHDVFISAFRDKITSLQDEFEDYNTYGKGDTSENSAARSRIMGELERVKNQAQNFRSGTEIFLDNLKNVDPGRVKYGPSVSAHQQALNFKDYDRLVKEGKISVVYGENGIEITSRKYDTRTTRVPLTNPSEQFLEAGSDNMMDQEESYGEDVIVTLASLNENFPASNLENFNDIVSKINDRTKIGVDQGTDAKIAFDTNGEMIEMDYNEEESNAVFTRLVNTEDNFKNVVDSTIDELYEVETSFKASLEKELNIPIAVLENMIIDDNDNGINDIEEIFKVLDRDIDGVISIEDIASGKKIKGFEQNLDSLIDALTNTTHPAFNLKESSKMLGAFLAKISKGRQEKAFKEKAGSRGNKTKIIKTKQVPLSVQQSRQKAAAIDKIVGSKINEQGIKSLKLELGARTIVSTLRGEKARKAGVADGTIEIMDSADNQYIIDPNNPTDARSILYGLAKINQEDRDEQIMGIAKPPGKTKIDYFNMITK